MELQVCSFLYLLMVFGQVSGQQQPGLVNTLTTASTENGTTTVLPQTTQQQPGPGLANLLAMLLTNNGTQSGLLQAAGVTDLLTTLLSNNGAPLALLQTPEIAANFVGLLDYLNTTRNATGVFDLLSTDPQNYSLTTLVTLLFESLSLTVLTNNRVSDGCQRDMIIFIEELVRGNPWALRMFDASGKPGSDLADGQTKFVGSYEECVAINAVSYTPEVNGNSRERGSFDAKYCSVVFPFPDIPYTLTVYGIGYLQLGVCLPNTCSNTDIQSLATFLERVIFNQTVPSLPTSHCVEGRNPVGVDFIIAVGIIGTLMCFVIAGSLYDITVIQGRQETLTEVTKNRCKEKSHSTVILDRTLTQENNEVEKENSDLEGCNASVITGTAEHETKTRRTINSKAKISFENIMKAFSIYTNGKRLLKAKQEGPLGAINGIRFLSLGWVILGHGVFYPSKFGANYFNYLTKEIPRWTTIVLEYTDISVDSFFAISGVLICYLTLKQLDKIGGPRKMNWFIFYFHRYWRLTPPYMLILMIGTVILPYTLDGPFWNYADFPFMEKCRKDWWANMLYLNNFYHTKIGDMCMEWSWYLANDMQFFIISPVLVVAFHYFAAAGFTLCIVLMIGCWLTAGWIAYNYMYPAQLFAAYIVDIQTTDQNYFSNLYTPSYTRIGPYIIGVMTGYLLYRWKCKCHIPKMVNLAGWSLSVSLTTVVLYSRFVNSDADLFSNLGSAVFQAVHRTVWAVAVCWIIFACATGHGGWINEFLSWKAFIPLGRMTFCAYLVHPLVIFSFSTSRRVLTYYTNYEMAYVFVFYISLSFGVAFIASLVLELPMKELEKILL